MAMSAQKIIVIVYNPDRTLQTLLNALRTCPVLCDKVEIKDLSTPDPFGETRKVLEKYEVKLYPTVIVLYQPDLPYHRLEGDRGVEWCYSQIPSVGGGKTLEQKIDRIVELLENNKGSSLSAIGKNLNPSPVFGSSSAQDSIPLFLPKSAKAQSISLPSIEEMQRRRRAVTEGKLV